MDYRLFQAFGEAEKRRVTKHVSSLCPSNGDSIIDGHLFLRFLAKHAVWQCFFFLSTRRKNWELIEINFRYENGFREIN